jgi:hypothetical protein
MRDGRSLIAGLIFVALRWQPMSDIGRSFWDR